MNTIDYQTGQTYRLDHRKIRIRSIVDSPNERHLELDCFIRLSYTKQLNFTGFIPYDVLGVDDEAIRRHIDEVILKLPVGTSARELSIFEKNMLNAISRTLVMANPNLQMYDASKMTASLHALVTRIKNNDDKSIVVPFSDVIGEASCDAYQCEHELLLGKHFIDFGDDNGVEVVKVSAKLLSLFYEITLRPQASPENEEDVPEAPPFLDSEGNALPDDVIAPDPVEESSSCDEVEIPTPPEDEVGDPPLN